MVAGAGIAPASYGYEPHETLLLHPAVMQKAGVTCKLHHLKIRLYVISPSYELKIELRPFLLAVVYL